MKKQIPLPLQPESISAALDFLQQSLEEQKLNSQKTHSAMLTVEELIVKMLSAEHGAAGKLHISVVRRFGAIFVRISAPGERFALEQTALHLSDISGDDWAPETETAIRAMILNAHREEIQLRHRRGVNTAVLTVQQSDHASLLRTLSCLAAGLLVGLLLRLLTPAAFCSWCAENLFGVVSSIYLNAVMMLVGPLVFFSMASCISQFSDLRSLGRLGAKVMGFYQVTTLIAILFAFGIYWVLQPGDPALIAAVSFEEGAAQTYTPVNISLRNTIVNIVPNNFAAAFVNADMIQLIVMGILLGSCVGGLGKYSESVQNMLDAMNELFIRAVTLIVKVMPLVVFCSMASLVVTMESASLVSLLGIVGCIYLFSALMITAYSMLVLLVGRLNPLPFLRKMSPVMLTALSVCSSSAVMPLNMETVGQKLGVSRKVYSFSIPLGATVNMDGTSFFLILCTLALGNVVGISFSGSQIMTMILSVILISFGAPGIPGAACICLAMLLKQCGIPVELVSLIISVLALIDPVLTVVNVTGDAAVTTMVAHSEGLLDTDVYYS